jgi:hypothetical protein
MAKKKASFLNVEKIKFILSAAVLLIILSVGFFLIYRAVPADKNIYRIENKYYGFEVATPKGWFAEGKTLYSEENIAQLLKRCQNDVPEEGANYEVGRFKFRSREYPQNFDQAIYSASNLPSGMILEVVANCIPLFANNKVMNYGYGDLEIGGEKALVGFLDYQGIGRTKYLSLLHGGLQYTIGEYIYISPNDKKADENGLRLDYSHILDEVVSTFKFLK